MEVARIAAEATVPKMLVNIDHEVDDSYVHSLDGRPLHHKARHCGYKEKDLPVLKRLSTVSSRINSTVNSNRTSLETGNWCRDLNASCQQLRESGKRSEK